MKVSPATMKNLITLRLNPDDDILLCLREAVRENNIQNGLILEGAGSCNAHHYHVVSSRVNPPEEIYVKAKAPADIVNINGMIIDGRVHAHITFANDKVAYGGHLEEGVKVLTFAVIVIAEIEERLTNYDKIGNIEDLCKE